LVSVGKPWCLSCLAKAARLNLINKGLEDPGQQTMLNMLRDAAGVW
jgi:hypothetical protein